MRTSRGRTFLAFFLKFLNFLQTFVGVSIILYSVYMLSQWNRHPVSPPLPTTLPADPSTFLSDFDAAKVSDQSGPFNLVAQVGPLFENGLLPNTLALPAPWFIYAFMSLGIILCCITCIGYIAAEAVSGCCLCFYTLLTIVLLLLEAALVVFIALDHQWEQDLPFDPTGELYSLRVFIERNVEVCMWVGIIVLIIQVLSILVATILRSLVSAQRVEEEIEEGYSGRGKTWEPLLNPHLSQTSGSIKDDCKGGHSDIWSSRIREKYGLSGGDAKSNLLNRSTSSNTKS